MLCSLALGLVSATITVGLDVKGVEKNYAYVTMWISGKHAPGLLKTASLMTPKEEKLALKELQKEFNLQDEDDETFKARVTPVNLVERLGGEEVAFMGTLRLAQMLQKQSSKYPLVVLTNDPKLLDIEHNEKKKEMYPNVIIKEINNEDWLKRECKLQPRNGFNYQKLSVFGLTEYDKLMWLDTEIAIRKNLDSVFDDYDLDNGNRVYRQVDDYTCQGSSYVDFCPGVMLFAPGPDRVTGLSDIAKSMQTCWGDQRVIRKYFKQPGREMKMIQLSHSGDL